MPKRTPRPGHAKPGELKAKWAKMRYANPDLCYIWGENTTSADAHLLHGIFHLPRYRPGQGWDEKPDPPFLEELEARGYDITTLKFSIRKKGKAV